MMVILLMSRYQRLGEAVTLCNIRSRTDKGKLGRAEAFYMGGKREGGRSSWIAILGTQFASLVKLRSEDDSDWSIEKYSSAICMGITTNREGNGRKWQSRIREYKLDNNFLIWMGRST